MMRKGEWLEIPAPKALQAGTDELEAYLIREIGIPESYLRRMNHLHDITRTGDRIRLRFFAAAPLGFMPEWQELHILYEDDFCLVVNKPAGMPVHPSDKDVGGTLANGVAFHYQAGGESIAVRHIHRLDVWTSGPVLYAKNAYAQYKLDEDMRHKRIARSYLAVVHGRPSRDRGIIEAPIGRDRHIPGKRRVSSGGQAAVTHYEVVERFRDAALLRLRLETGRTHQIRVHLSHMHHPIIGDTLYGGSDDPIGRQALHGFRLGFRHPFSGEQLELEAELPDDMRDLLVRLARSR